MELLNDPEVRLIIALGALSIGLWILYVVMERHAIRRHKAAIRQLAVIRQETAIIKAQVVEMEQNEPPEYPADVHSH